MSDWLADLIRREGDVLFSTHPSAEELLRYHESANELDAARVRAIDAHVRVCAACDDDLRRLRAVDDELRSLTSAPGAKPQGRSRKRIRVTTWLPTLLAATMAALWIGAPDRERVPEVVAVGSPTVLRSEVERGAVVTVHPGAHGRIALVFTLPATDAGPTHCDVSIVDAHAREVLRLDGVGSLDGFGSFALSIDASALESSDYTLIARDEAGEIRFGFRVEHE